MLYALLHKNKIIGLYDDLTKCKNMVIGLSSNKFVKQEELEIHTYIKNSITKTKTPNIYQDQSTEIIEEYSDTETTISSDSENTKQRKFKKQQDIEYNLNILKKKKEKLEEKKNIYNADLKLYEKFKDMKNKDTNFEIPDMFQSKYEIFTILEENKKLTFQNFIDNYKEDNISTNYDSLFIGNKKKELELIEISSENKSNENNSTSICSYEENKSNENNSSENNSEENN